MKAKIVNKSEITKNNPTLCLSPNRYLGECKHCQVFRMVFKRNNYNLAKTLLNIKCRPMLSQEDYKTLIEEANLRIKAQKINAKIAEISKEV